MAYDPKCLELAEYFVPGNPPRAHLLAQTIQDAIEDWLVLNALAGLVAEGDEDLPCECEGNGPVANAGYCPVHGGEEEDKKMNVTEIAALLAEKLTHDEMSDIVLVIEDSDFHDAVIRKWKEMPHPWQTQGGRCTEVRDENDLLPRLRYKLHGNEGSDGALRELRMRQCDTRRNAIPRPK